MFFFFFSLIHQIDIFQFSGYFFYPSAVAEFSYCQYEIHIDFIRLFFFSLVIWLNVFNNFFTEGKWISLLSDCYSNRTLQQKLRQNLFTTLDQIQNYDREITIYLFKNIICIFHLPSQNHCKYNTWMLLLYCVFSRHILVTSYHSSNNSSYSISV